MPNEEPNVPHILDDPPPHHSKLLSYGERPYWTNDGARIAFVESNYGDICELDVATGQVRNLTEGSGEHHSFLRVLVLCNGDYLLVGPAEFKNRDVSRRVESELWVLDQNLRYPPKPLGRRMFEGVGISPNDLRITYAVSGRNDPSIGGPEVVECHVTEIVYGDDGPRLGDDKVFFRTTDGSHPEPQDFRADDNEVVFAHYPPRAFSPPMGRSKVMGYNLERDELITYLDEPYSHNEPEGIFPDRDYICLESACDTDWPFFPPKNLWKLKLDGSQQRARMTSMPADSPWKATNSNVSPDGRWLAFMVGLRDDEPGYGRGLGLLDLAAWEKTEQAQEWETPVDRFDYIARRVVDRKPDDT